MISYQSLLLSTIIVLNDSYSVSHQRSRIMLAPKVAHSSIHYVYFVIWKYTCKFIATNMFLLTGRTNYRTRTNFRGTYISRMPQIQHFRGFIIKQFCECSSHIAHLAQALIDIISAPNAILLPMQGFSNVSRFMR